MTDSPSGPLRDDRGADRGYEDSGGVRRWVKVATIAVAIAALLVVIALQFGGGEHGPQRHQPGGDQDGNTPPTVIHTPPPGGHGG